MTIREEAVWYLWGTRRARILELAELFGVSTRTIKRDLAAIRARGWKRPPPREEPESLVLDLVIRARTMLDDARRLGYKRLDAAPAAGRDAANALDLLVGLSGTEARLALAAAELARAAVATGEDRSGKERELIRAELCAELAALLGE